MIKRGLWSDSVIQGSSSGSPASIDLLTQLGGQDAQDCLNRNWDNAETDTSETLQNEGNLSAGQKNTLSQFFLKSVLSLFWNAAGLEHKKGIHQLKQTAQEETLKNTTTVSLQNIWNVSPLHIIRTLSMMKQNAILMQNENEFDTEKLKGFKPEKASIYTEKSIYKLKNWICTCENAFFLKDFQKNLIRVCWTNQFLNSKKHQIMKKAQIQC